MIWPFLMLYVSERLDLPLTAIASLMTLNAGMGLVFSFIAGPVTDWFGRQWVMVLSLAMNGLVYLFFSQATTLGHFALLMAVMGAFNPLYRVGADAMMADLIEPEKRVDAYSLLRLSNNVGVSLGPAIGGFIAASSYNLAFYFAASGLVIYSLLVAFFASETLPSRAGHTRPRTEKLAGYGRILRDRRFMPFAVSITLTQVCISVLWVLLSVYSKQNFGLPENLYGLIPTTNAVMVVLFQIAVTNRTKRFAPLPVMTVGTLFYAIGVGSVALGQGFWGFWLCMVIATIGELILIPTATTYVANLAPPEMRGRYMSIYGLTWGLAAGTGPVLGGFLNDNFGPVYIWIGAGAVGLVATLAFLVLSRAGGKEMEPQMNADIHG